MTNGNHSPYRRGADDGFVFGIYLSVLYIAMALNLVVPYAGFVATILAIGVPVIIYKFLRRSYVKDYGTTPFASLWMQGIMIFLCGTLIMAFVAYIYMRWIDPDYLLNEVTRGIEIFGASDKAQEREFAEILQKALDNNLIPSPIQLATQMITLGVFSGSLLSIIVSLLVQVRKVNTK